MSKPPKHSSNPWQRIAFLSVGIMIGLRLLIYYNYLKGREVYFFSDSAVYGIMARRFLAGDFWHAFHLFWNPGLSLAMVPFYLIIHSWESAQFLVSVFSVTLLIISVFWFFKEYSLFLAFILAFITTFSVSLQTLVVGGGMSEPLYILLLWTGIFCGWQALTTKETRFYVLTGVFLGLAYLTRVEALTFFTVFLMISFLNIFFRKIDTKTWLPKIIAVVFCFFWYVLPI